jgi:hypothetical protein
MMQGRMVAPETRISNARPINCLCFNQKLYYVAGISLNATLSFLMEIDEPYLEFAATLVNLHYCHEIPPTDP